MYHESARIILLICMFMFPLLFLGLKITTSFYLYPILRFNKEDLSYLQSLTMLGCYTVKTVLSHGLLIGFEY